MKKIDLVFFPVPGPTHLISTVQFAKLLLHRHATLHITILSMKPFYPDTTIDDIFSNLTHSHPRIHLLDLPQVDPPSPDLLHKSFEAYFTAFVESHKPHVKAAISQIQSRSQSDSGRVAGLVIDMFCLSMIDVASQLHIPSYIFLTTNASFLALMMYLSTHHAQIGTELNESGPDLLIPGFLNSVPSRVLPGVLLNKQGGYDAFAKLSQRFRDAKGIIVNTFSELESPILKSLSDAGSPPIYPVGPVLQPDGLPNPNLDRVQREQIMQWLDDQPDSSVVYLCFGTHGSFSGPQLKEIALGLEESGIRFLWAIRASQPNNEDVLPEGFLERNKGKGVVCSWAPQVEVLSHKATGGFVSHCGWNSILESLWHGVPTLTWPIYAEQQFNAFGMVREMGLAVELRLDYRREQRELVMAAEIERAVRSLMDNDNEIRNKVKKMKEMARIAVMDGGSSFNSIGLLIEDITSTSSLSY